MIDGNPPRSMRIDQNWRKKEEEEDEEKNDNVTNRQIWKNPLIEACKYYGKKEIFLANVSDVRLGY